jgi:hypothetical protein
MKVSELKENIRAKVREALTVKLAGGSTLTTPQKSAKITALRTTTGDPTVGTEKNPIDFVKEMNITDEDDNTIIEDVEDIDSSGEGMAKYYDEVYEINANVAPGSRYQIEVRKDGNFIILTQDNGQEIVINPEDVKDLVKIILQKYNEI